MTASSEKSSTVPQAVLAICLLLVELIAGLQTFVVGTITPLVAQEFQAQDLYGLITAVSLVSVFLTMPISPALMRRWSAATLLMAITPIFVLGGVVSALAPSLEVYLTGRVVSGLASGALMGVALAALVTTLPERWRRMVLAGYSATWVVSGLLGPGYAGWVTEVAGWRWALVGYLPLLVIVRFVIARQLRTLDKGSSPERSSLGLGAAVVLTAGVALVTVSAQLTPLALGLAAIGVVAALAATARILPAGVFTLRRGRPSAIALLGLLCGAYFGGHAVVTIVAHDLLGRRPADLALLLGVGVLPWAVLGMACGRWPAGSMRSLRARLGTAALLQATGLVTAAAAVLIAAGADSDGQAWIVLIVGWALTGTGMGLAYLDVLDMALTGTPAGQVAETSNDPGDDIGPAVAARAALMVEVVATALVGTLASTAVAAGLTATGSVTTTVLAAVFAVLAVIALAMLPVLPRLSRRLAGARSRVGHESACAPHQGGGVT